MIQIRAAQSDDAATIIRFQREMALETEDLRLDEPTVAAGVRGVLDDSTKGQYLIAEIDGEVVGSLLTVPEWSDWRNGTVLWIHSLYVRPDYRRRGVYRAMYAHLRQRVEVDDMLKGLRLYVDKRNAAAMQTYEALGMDGDHYRMYEWIE